MMLNDGKNFYKEALGFSIAVHIAGFFLVVLLGLVWPAATDDIIEVTLAAGEVQQLPRPEEKPSAEPEKPKPVIPQPKLADEGIKKEVRQVNPAPAARQQSEKVGDGGKDEFTSMPKILKKVKPDYPPAARNMDKQGRVLVELLISSRGVVEQANIVQSSGFAALDEAVLKAVYKWRFAAAKNRYGRPCACKVVIPVKFELK